MDKRARRKPTYTAGFWTATLFGLSRTCTRTKKVGNDLQAIYESFRAETDKCAVLQYLGI